MVFLAHVRAQYRMGRDVMDMNFLGPRIMDKLVLAFSVMSLYWRVGANQARAPPVCCTHAHTPRALREVPVTPQMGGCGGHRTALPGHNDGCRGHMGAF